MEQVEEVAELVKYRWGKHGDLSSVLQHLYLQKLSVMAHAWNSVLGGGDRRISGFSSQLI